MKKMRSFRLSEGFIAKLDKLAERLQKQEDSAFPWAMPWTKTRALVWAVTHALEEIEAPPAPAKKSKKPARRRAVR
jgi:hypothetical protein